LGDKSFSGKSAVSPDGEEVKVDADLRKLHFAYFQVYDDASSDDRPRYVERLFANSETDSQHEDHEPQANAASFAALLSSWELLIKGDFNHCKSAEPQSFKLEGAGGRLSGWDLTDCKYLNIYSETDYLLLKTCNSLEAVTVDFSNCKSPWKVSIPPSVQIARFLHPDGAEIVADEKTSSITLEDCVDFSLDLTKCKLFKFVCRSKIPPKSPYRFRGLSRALEDATYIAVKNISIADTVDESKAAEPSDDMRVLYDEGNDFVNDLENARYLECDFSLANIAPYLLSGTFHAVCIDDTEDCWKVEQGMASLAPEYKDRLKKLLGILFSPQFVLGTAAFFLDGEACTAKMEPILEEYVKLTKCPDLAFLIRPAGKAHHGTK